MTFEAETATVGSNWQVHADRKASNGKYVVVQPDTQSIQAAPSGSESFIAIPFSVKKTGAYSVFARLNCPSADDDSFWVKMDDGRFTMSNNLGTRGWDWVKLANLQLKAGKHKLTIAYREDGAKLDKISISNDRYAPEGMGKPARNLGAAN